MAQTIKNVPRKGVGTAVFILGGVRHDLGKTTQDGYSIRYSGSNLRTFSGQSTAPVADEPTERLIEITINHLSASPKLKRILLGLPQSAHTGDLGAGTPTAETIFIRQGEMGTVKGSLELTAPGDAGPVTQTFPVVAVQPDLEEGRAQNKNVGYVSKWLVLDPQDGSPLETDVYAP